MRILLISALTIIVVLLCSCTTPKKTFKPPNNAKVTASTKKVQEGVTKAHETAKEAKKEVVEAQKSADKIIVVSGDIEQKLDLIIQQAPPELQQALAEIKTDVTALRAEEDLLNGFLKNAQIKQDLLEKHQATLDVDVEILKSNQNNYYTDAQGLANDATNERNERIKVEKQLIQQKIFGWAWKIGGVIVLLLIGAGFVLWWTGKIAWKLK